jgi:hypothetical protein
MRRAPSPPAWIIYIDGLEVGTRCLSERWPSEWVIEHFVCQNLVEYVYLSVEQKSHVAVFTDPLLVTDREGGRGDVIDRHLSLVLPPVFSFFLSLLSSFWALFYWWWRRRRRKGAICDSGGMATSFFFLLCEYEMWLRNKVMIVL